MARRIYQFDPPDRFVAGTVGVLGLMLVAPPLAKFALSFSSPEYFALMTLGLALVVLLAGRSMVKALLAMLFGLWIATMGTDLFSSSSRFTFGNAELLDGIDFVACGLAPPASACHLFDGVHERAMMCLSHKKSSSQNGYS